MNPFPRAATVVALLGAGIAACAPTSERGGHSSVDTAVVLSTESAPPPPLSPPAEPTLPPLTDSLWLLAPDSSGDAVRITDTEDSLVARYGARNVVRKEVEGEDGWMIPVTVLFPGDSLRRLEIVWEDTIARRSPKLLTVMGKAWRVPPGIGLGASLPQLEALNGGPFELAWFRGHDSGTITGWSGGRLASFQQREGRGHWQLYLRLDPPAPHPPDIDFDAYGAEAVLSSAHSVIQRLRPRVVTMELVAP